MYALFLYPWVSKVMSEWDPSNNLNYQEETIEGAMEAHDITTPLSVLPLVSFGEKKKKQLQQKLKGLP